MMRTLLERFLLNFPVTIVSMASHERSAESFILDLNGLRFQVLSQGVSQSDVVLLLHGFPQFADVWLPVMPQIAAAGLRAVAIDQRGYSPDARPLEEEHYAISYLLSDVLGLADSLGISRFHLVGHDWGGLVAWHLAAKYPARVRSLSVLSTPHPDAFLIALQTDADQKERSKYIDFFRMPGGVAESYFQANNWQALRRVYQGRVPEQTLEENIRRLAAPGAVTAALNWYRALDLNARIGFVHVPTLFLWGSDDSAVGENAALNTAYYVKGPYEFEKLAGQTHWLLEEDPTLVASRLLRHFNHADSAVF